MKLFNWKERVAESRKRAAELLQQRPEEVRITVDASKKFDTVKQYVLMGYDLVDDTSESMRFGTNYHLVFRLKEGS